MIQQRKPQTIDEYISMCPDNVQSVLKKLRKVINDSAPGVEETISYQIPTFKLKGNLVHFAAFKDHISFFPTSSARIAFKKELSKYRGGKGTIQFPMEKSIPYDLVKRIVKFRVKENLGKARRK